MTTAKLSVGIDTSQAKADLLALRKDMQSQPSTLLLNVNVEGLKADIQKKVAEHKYRFNFSLTNLGNLKTEMQEVLNSALNSAFAKPRQVSWQAEKFRGDLNASFNRAFENKDRWVGYNRSALITQVHADIATAMVGHSIKAGVSATGAGAAEGGGSVSPSVIAAMQRTILQTLMPAVEELSKAATAIAAVARKAGATGSAGGATKAAESISAKNADGFTTRFSRTLENPGLELGKIQQALAVKQVEIDDAAKLKMMQASSNKTLAARQRLARLEAAQIEREYDALNDASKQREVGRIAALGEASRRQASIEAGKERNDVLQRAEDLRKLKAQRLFDNQGMAYGPSRRTFESGNAAGAAASAAEAERRDVLTRAEDVRSRRAQAKFNEQGFSYGPDRSTYDAGLAAARKNIGPVADDHKRLAANMREAHSAARGLASGFGAIWLTYGQVAPLIAGAAISTGLVRSVKDGMAVGQELATIKFLGGESAAAISTLNAALLNTKANGPFGPIEVAAALKTLSLAGLNARQQLEALPAVLNFSLSGQVSLEKSAETLVSVATAYGYTAKDFSVVGDIVTKTAASSMASVDSMSESFKAASVVAQQYKVGLADTATTLALLSQVGIKGSAAGTAMRQMYSELSGSSPKARKVLEETLKVDVIDKFTGGMKPLGTIISQVSAALDKFDAKGQLRLLMEMGNERGTKALAANMTAYRTELDRTGKTASNELARMQQLMEDAPGFMAEAAVGMSLTSQNQIKAVASSLQTSLVSTFQAIEPSVLQVSLQLKNMFASPEFKGGLQNMITGVANLTTFLVNHAGVITEVAKAYLAWKVITIGMSALTSVTSWVGQLGQGMMTLGVRSKIAAAGTVGINAALAATPALANGAAVGVARLQAALGWISLIGTVLAAGVTWWALYKEKSIDASVSSSNAARAAYAATSESMDSEIARLEKSIELRQRGTEEALIAQETASLIGLEYIRSMGDQERAVLKVVHAQNLLLLAKVSAPEYDQTGAGARKRAGAAVDTSRAGLVDSYFKQYQEEEKYETKSRNLRNLAKQNAREATAAAAERTKGKFGDTEYKGEPKKSGLPRAQDKSELDATLQGIRDEEAATKQYIKFRKDLDAAKYDPALFGTQASAALAEQREINATTELLQQQEDVVKRLKDLLNKDSKSYLKNLNPADRTKVETNIKTEEEKLQRERTDLANNTRVAKAKADSDSLVEANRFAKEQVELSAKTAQQRADLEAKYSYKVKDGGEVAREKAIQDVEKEYSSTIIARQELINNGRALENKLIADKIALQNTGVVNPYDMDALDAALAATRANTAIEEARLSSTKGRMTGESKVSGDQAKGLYDQAQTAEYGFGKFWEEYTSKAESSAKQVQDVMKSTTDNISTGLSDMLTKGKAGWGSLGRSILSTMTKVVSDQATAKLLSMFNGGGAAGAVAGAASGPGWGGMLLNSFTSLFADGGIMTSRGALPLRKYAGGGIAHGPQVSIHGESSLPEANVPLQDGRSIPVTLQGGGGASKAVSLSYAPTINIDSRSDQAQIAAMVQASVSEGNRQMMQHLKDTGALA